MTASYQTSRVATGYDPQGPLTAAPTWPSASVSILAYAGRYRISVLGFEVLQPTIDDMLETDGKGDEVFPLAFVTLLEPQVSGSKLTLKAVTGPTKLVGRTHGDITGRPLRVQAGPAGPNGGLRAGDRVPASLNLAASVVPNASGSFPFVLYEGLITNNQILAVHPMLWEEDVRSGRMDAYLISLGAGIPGWYPKDYWNWVRGDFAPNLGSIGFECENGNPGQAVFDAVTGTAKPGICLAGEHRPIGVVPSVFYVTYRDRWQLFTRDAIEKGPTTFAPYSGAAPGVFSFSLKEEGEYQTGNYTVHRRLERLP